MSTDEAILPLVTIDANIPLAVAFPRASRMSPEDIEGARRVMHALDRKKIAVVIPSIALGEMKWVYVREGRSGFEIIQHRLQVALKDRIDIIDISAELAIQAAEYRGKYYSRQHPFSYNDGLYLAVAVSSGVQYLISADPHLLKIEEVETLQPRDFLLPETGEANER